MELKKKTWKDISIKDYKEIVEISRRELDSDLEKDIALAALLYDTPERDLYDLSVGEMKQVLMSIAWIKEPFTFNYKWSAKHLNINGKKCRMYQSIEELTVAQYMDFQTFWEDRDNRQGSVLACFIVPEGHKYNEGYDATEFAEELESTLSIQDWNSIAFFLLKNWLVSIRASIRYSVWVIQKMIWKERNREKKKELREIRRGLISQLRHMR